jgi:O-antigen ligase
VTTPLASAGAIVLAIVGSLLAMHHIAFAGLIIGAVWLILPSRPNATPKWLSFLLLGVVFGSLLPNAISLLFQGIVLVVAYALWLAAPSVERRAKSTVLWTSLLLLYWAVLMFHANIPGLDIALLGWRKTAFCLVGLVLGAAVAKRHVPAVERTVVKLVLVAVAGSIALYFLAPGLEQSLVERNADEYTGVLGGVARLQGIFAGPFHAAVAGLMLAIWGFARFRTERLLATLALGFGLAAVYLTLVRTAYVALAIGIAFMILASPTAGRAIRRLLGFGLVAVAAVAVASSFNSAALSVLESITSAGTDTRFLGRFPGYAEGFELFSRSPIFGWGAGSAGDTLGSAFLVGEHITSHNVILKIAVEGGLIGLVLWAAMAVSVLHRLRRGTPLTSAAVGMMGVILGMGLTGSAIETLPPTFLIFLIVGLALDQEPASTTEKPQAVSLRGARKRVTSAQ